MTAIQIHRRGVDDTAARGDGRDCAASFCLFCRVFVCFAARCCRCGSEERSWSEGTGWVLRGTREYYWGPAGVLLEYCYSRCSPEEPSSIPLTANCKGPTSYRGQRHGIAIRLLGVALLSTAPVSTRLKVVRVPLVAPNQSGCGDSTSGDDGQHEQEYAKTKWLSTRPIHHGHDLAGRT